MMDVALFGKSHRPDLVLVHLLLDSISRHDRDRIGVLVSVPVGYMVVFQDLSLHFTDVSVLADDHFGIPRIDRKIWRFASEDITQQVVKLSVQYPFKARNYLILGSDTYFIHDFATEDFIAPGGTDLTVLAEDKDLVADPAYPSFAAVRVMKTIAHRLGVPALSRATCHNNTVFRDSVSRDFHDWCRSEGVSLLDLMAVAARSSETPGGSR